MAFLSESALREMGFAHLGADVKISDKASIYGAGRISIGDFSRIDDFVVLSAGEGGIGIGQYVHIAVFASLIGAGTITVKDFANLSSRVALYSSNDDYSGNAMTNPTIDERFTAVAHGPVTVGRHTIIGCGTVVLPDVDIADCVSIGALSLVNADCESHRIYAGTPAVIVGERSRNVLAVEKAFLGCRRGT
jgi:galactoside O-acetyltransferase